MNLIVRFARCNYSNCNKAKVSFYVRELGYTDMNMISLVQQLLLTSHQFRQEIRCGMNFLWLLQSQGHSF